MKDIVIFGTRGLGQIVRDYLHADHTRRVVAHTVERRFAASPQFEGLPVYPFEELEAQCPPSTHALLIAIGQMDRNRLRARVFDDAVARGYEIETFVDAAVRRHASNRIGRGCLIFENVSLQPYADIGDNVVIRPLAYVGHHATIESHCFIAPHAALLGECRIGAYSFVAAQATVSSRVTIGPRSVIAAGAVVTHDVPANSIVRRTP